jgi:hypothetical protein
MINMNVKLVDLHWMSERIFEHLRELGVESVDIPVDYYWNIPKGQIYNPYQQPTELDLGQLTDDWRELQKLTDPESQPIAYHLVWLSTILRAIGEHTPV